jgi:hypothetical protein
MAEVVALRSRSTNRPDFAALARRQIGAARRALELSTPAFASLLTPLVGWPVSAEVVEAWERDTAPPGEILLAAYSAAPDILPSGSPIPGSEQLIGNVLAAIHPNFSADALDGYWVTSFQFGPESNRKRHIDLAQISAESERFMTITNHPPAPRSEGRASPFCNDLEAQLTNRHLVGHWKNSSDTRYFGTFHLAVLSGETVMAGYYTGFGSDIEVSMGPWKWVRLNVDPAADADLSKVRLRDPAELGPRIEEHTPYDSPLTLADIEEEL